MRAVPMLAVYGCVLLAGSPPSVVGQAGTTQRAGMSSPVYLIIRTDDAGMSHSVNLALQRLIDARLPLSVSVMFPCPWYQETVEILKRHPEVAVGIHLTLNSEWKNYRWGPVSGREAGPTLVDTNGYFFQSAEALYNNHPDVRQVEKELRAQIERARRSGLKIDYVDYHMGTEIGRASCRERGEGRAGPDGSIKRKTDVRVLQVHRRRPRRQATVRQTATVD